MNDQYYSDRVKTPNNVERTDQLTNNLEVNSDPLTGRFAVEEPYTHQTPSFERLTSKDTTEETIADEFLKNESIADKAPVPIVETVAHETPVSAIVESSAAFFTLEESDRFRTHWSEIQGKFVDDPHTAVEQADELVSEVIDHITHMFANEHSTLESQWKQGNEASTEDLRKALQHYRSFFNRLVV